MRETSYEGPEVLHICLRCGRLASGACETCRKMITVYAPAAAAAMLDRGCRAPVFAPAAEGDAWERAWRETVTEEFHRQRAARLYGALPREEGEAETRPGWYGVAVLAVMVAGLVGVWWGIVETAIHAAGWAR